MSDFPYYEDMQKKLFKKSYEVDYLKHFFDLNKSKYTLLLLNEKVIDSERELKRGKHLGITILLEPGRNITISRKGEDFYNQLLKFYNDKYWLILLWSTMYRNTSNSAIGKEITRAFIKNCIARTAKRLLITNKNQITSQDISVNSINTIEDFYKEVFSVANIVQNMRAPQRRKLKETYNGKPSEEIKKINEIGLNSPELLLELFDNNELSAFKPIVEIWLSAKSSDKGIRLIKGFSFLIKSTSHRSFKRELVNIFENKHNGNY